MTDTDLASNSDVTIYKSNEVIGLTLKSGSLGHLARKIFNILIHNVQPGNDIYGPENAENASDYYWIRWADLKARVDYNSNSMKELEQELSSLKQVELTFRSSDDWQSSVVISTVRIFTDVNERGLRTTWVGFIMPAPMLKMVLSPSRFTPINIKYQNVFKTGASIALYEICRRYLNSPQKKTNSNPMSYWYSVILGRPISEGNSPQYKYFKRDYLAPSIIEINTLSDIKIELVEEKGEGGRKITSLHFKVSKAELPKITLDNSENIKSSLLNNLTAIGFTESEMEELFSANQIENLIMVMEQLRIRLDSKTKKVGSAKGYYLWLLKKKLQARKIDDELNQKLENAENLSPVLHPNYHEPDREKRLATDKAWLTYEKLPLQEQKRLFAIFRKETPQNDLILGNSTVVSSSPSKALFKDWFATHLVHNPLNVPAHPPADEHVIDQQPDLFAPAKHPRGRPASAPSL